MKTAAQPLLNSRHLAKNVLWNIIGMLAPLLVAIITIPILINSIGTEKFGVLSIIWMVIGYFSLFDLGLGRTLTKLIAQKLGQQRVTEQDIARLTWTTLALMMVLSIMGALVVYFLTPWLVYDLLKLPSAMQSEVSSAFRFLALSIPLVIMTTAFRGILEAYQYFSWVNIIRLPMGIFTFLGPVLVLPFSHSLEMIVIVLLIGRAVSFLAHVVVCLKLLPVLKGERQFVMSLVPYLLSFGGWMSVTNVIGPLMVYLDRFIIGAVLTMSAVAYYTTPYEMVTKLWLIPGVVLPVLFPAFSMAEQVSKAKLVRLYFQGMLFIVASIFPLSLLISLFAYDGLALWLNAEFAGHSSRVLQLLALGVFINSFAQVSFSLVQGMGRPDLTAKLHLFELPFYLFGLWLLIPQYGIVGVALVWTLRISVDTLVLFFMVNYLLPEAKVYAGKIALAIFLALLLLMLSLAISGVWLKSIYLLAAVIFAMLFLWFYLLAFEDRQRLQTSGQLLLRQVLG